jgi:uncharacterized membrane protein YfcA
LLDIILTAVVLSLVGLGAGAIGAMVGVGGGVIMVPALTLFGISPTQIASTSLIAVTSTSASSTLEYSRQKRIDHRLALLMAALALPGAVLGAVLSQSITIEQFTLFFGILLLLAGLYVSYKNRILGKQDVGRRPLNAYRIAAVCAASLLAGVMSSLFGVGGGIVFVPVMLLVLGMGMHRASATSQLVLMLTSVAGVITHIVLGHPDYIYAIALSAGAFAGAQIGAKLSKSTKEIILQKILGGVLVAVGVKMVVDWFLSR